MQSDQLSVSTASRLPGLDLARFLAVAGMVLVHARSDLAAFPSGAGAPWFELVQAVAINRARLLFFLLAGVGVALLVRRRAVGSPVLLRRAAFLTALGFALAASGWSDVVLVFYGALFVLAPLLVRLGDRLLVALAVMLAVPGVLRLGMEPSADDTLTNVLLVVGEMVPLFCIGLVIRRRNLGDRSVLRAVGGVGLVLTVAGLAVLVHQRGFRGLDVARVSGPFEPAAALASTAGMCLLVVVACLRLAPAGSDRFPRLVVAGGMPLSGYVGHALLFPLLAGATEWGLGVATGAAVAYLSLVVWVATPWRRWRGSGPVEKLMRFVSGPRRSAVVGTGTG